MKLSKESIVDTIAAILAFIWIAGLVNIVSYPCITAVVSIFSNKYSNILWQHAKTLGEIAIFSFLACAFVNGISYRYFEKKEPKTKEQKSIPIPYSTKETSMVSILLTVFVMMALPPSAIIGWHIYQEPPAKQAVQESGNIRRYEIKPRTETQQRPQLPPPPAVNTPPKNHSNIQKENSVPLVLYIGNRRTKKFHRSGCSSVDKMNERNMVEFEKREDALAAGYIPCKRCYP